MKNLRLGLIVGSRDIEKSFAKIKMLDLSICQISFLAEEIDSFDPYFIKKQSENYGIEIFAVFMLFKGQ
ncbi:MAG: hypothetical protein NC816_07230, partial [Candidatus Omnitrophica bacterium]|nr:hypothetical protein [Candidatus Omnitrophota bacterium]